MNGIIVTPNPRNCRFHVIGKNWQICEETTNSHPTIDANYESINNKNADTSIHFDESEQQN